MRTGYAAVTFDVPHGAAMGGYADRAGGVAARLAPLQVAALTWYDGTRRAALAIVDAICVNRDLVTATRRLLPDVGLVVVAATHTHAGPETGCRPGGAPTPEPWLDRIAGAAADAVRAAASAERPSRATVHSGQLWHVGARRDVLAPEPVVPLDVVAVRDPAGDLAGALVVLPVHPTVLPATNRSTSPDLPGAVRDALRGHLPAGAWCAVATGAAGDVSTRHTRRGQDAAELARLGGLVAARCRELLDEPGAPGWAQPDGLSWRVRQLEAPGRRPAADAALLATAEADFAGAARSGDGVATRIAEARVQGARLASGRQPSGPVPVELAVLKAGALHLVALPGEPFLHAAWWLRGRLGPTAVTLGYANGYPGYLPTTEAYRRGGYEALVTAVAEGTLETILDHAAAMVGDLDTGAGTR